MSAEVFDYAGLCERVAGRVDLVESLIDLLLDSYPIDRTGLSKLLAAGDAGEFRELAHRLKGQLQTLGINAAAGEALRLELMGRDHQLNDAVPVLAALDREMDRFMETVARRRAGHAGA